MLISDAPCNEKSELKLGLHAGILHLVLSCSAAIWRRHRNSIFGDRANRHAADFKTFYPPDFETLKVSAIASHTLEGRGISAVEREPGRRILLLLVVNLSGFRLKGAN